MGRVFDAEFFYDDEPGSFIPTEDDFRDGLEFFEAAVAEEIENGLVDGAIVFGSVALGAYSIRSDLDGLVVRTDASKDSAEAVKRIVCKSDPGGRLPIGLIAHTKDILASGRHEVDEFFGDHLSGDGRLVYGNDPAEYVRFSNNTPESTLLSYIRHKKRSVSLAFAGESIAERTKGMQRTLELPLAVGRKTIRVLETIEGQRFFTGNTADKSLLSSSVLDLYTQHGLDEVPRATLELDKRYTAVLKAALNGEATLAEYLGVLRDIEAMANESYAWLDDFDQAIGEQLTLLKHS